MKKSIEPELLDKHALSVLLGMGEKGARRLCEEHGILPIDVSPNGARRKTLRWSRSEVMQMLGSMQGNTVPNSDFVPIRRSVNRIVGKSFKQLVAELGAPMQ